MWREEPADARRDFLIGLDLAQGGADWTALAVAERVEPADGGPAAYGVIHLERWRDKRTARIPERVGAVWRQLVLLHRQREFERTGRGVAAWPDVRLVVDQTGVGPFGLDPLREAGFSPIGVVIHGGDAVTRPDAATYRAPKRDIAGAVNVLLQSGRLRIEASLPDAAALKAELENFRAKINIATGHDSYAAGPAEAWREGAHDDLVLAVGVAAWLGESQPVPRLDAGILAHFDAMPG